MEDRDTSNKGETSLDEQAETLKRYFLNLPAEEGPYYVFACEDDLFVYLFERLSEEGFAERISYGFYKIPTQAE